MSFFGYRENDLLGLDVLTPEQAKEICINAVGEEVAKKHARYLRYYRPFYNAHQVLVKQYNFFIKLLKNENNFADQYYDEIGQEQLTERLVYAAHTCINKINHCADGLKKIIEKFPQECQTKELETKLRKEATKKKLDKLNEQRKELLSDRLAIEQEIKFFDDQSGKNIEELKKILAKIVKKICMLKVDIEVAEHDCRTSANYDSDFFMEPPASDCEITGVCVCSRNKEPYTQSCLLTPILLRDEQSAKEHWDQSLNKATRCMSGR